MRFDQGHRAFGPSDCNWYAWKARSRADIDNPVRPLWQRFGQKKGLTVVQMNGILQTFDAREIELTIPLTQQIVVLLQSLQLLSRQRNFAAKEFSKGHREMLK